MVSLHKQSCPTCGQSVNEREISLFDGLIQALWRVMRWCSDNNRYEFKKKEIKHLLGSDVVSANFAYLRWFGGLLYNPDGIQGHYGINIGRCRDFFGGRIKIPMKIYRDPLKSGDAAYRSEEYVFVHQIPHLTTFLDENKNYIAVYRDPQDRLL